MVSKNSTELSSDSKVRIIVNVNCEIFSNTASYIGRYSFGVKKKTGDETFQNKFDVKYGKKYKFSKDCPQCNVKLNFLISTVKKRSFKQNFLIVLGLGLFFGFNNKILVSNLLNGNHSIEEIIQIFFDLKFLNSLFIFIGIWIGGLAIIVTAYFILDSMMIDHQSSVKAIVDLFDDNSVFKRNKSNHNISYIKSFRIDNVVEVYQKDLNESFDL